MPAAHGWLVIDKPHGMNSRAVVDHAQRWFPRKTAIGHAGTLDPLATGVLVLAVGNATRLVEYVQDMGKVYESEFTLGDERDRRCGGADHASGGCDCARTKRKRRGADRGLSA